MEKFDLEALMATIDTTSATQFNVVRLINLDAAEITLDQFKEMLSQAKSIYESEEDHEITVICVHPREDENTFLYAFVNEGESIMFCPIRFNGVDLLKESRMCTTAIVNRLYMMEYGEIVKLEYNRGRIVNKSGRWIKTDELLWLNKRGRLYFKTFEDIR